MRAASLVAVVFGALVLAACSSTTSGTPVSPPASGGNTTPSASTPGPTGFPSSAPSSGGGLTQAQAQAALLTAAQVGNGFVPAQIDNTDAPLPCTPNEPTPSKQFPPDVKVEADFSGAAGKALFSEEIETYADAATIDQVVAAGEKGLGCGTTTVGGTTITIVGPSVLTSRIPVPVDKAEAWSVSAKDLRQALVIVQMDNQLVVFSLSGDASVDNSQVPDPPTLITAGLVKVKTALR